MFTYLSSPIYDLTNTYIPKKGIVLVHFYWFIVTLFGHSVLGISVRQKRQNSFYSKAGPGISWLKLPSLLRNPIRKLKFSRNISNGERMVFFEKFDSMVY